MICLSGCREAMRYGHMTNRSSSFFKWMPRTKGNFIMEPSMMMSTERTYYQDTYLSTIEASVVEVGADDTGGYAVFDKTIFHPQGGGQPDDKGHFEIDGKAFTVKKLIAPRNPKEDPYIIKHYYDVDEASSNLVYVGQKVQLVIDKDFRKLCARLHSAGHLLSNAVNELHPSIDGCNGNHFAGQAFVMFKADATPDITKLKTQAAELVNEYIKKNLALKNEWSGESRTIQFGELKSYPCGGTHVANASEIGSVTIRNVKKEKTGFKIGYDIE